MELIEKQADSIEEVAKYSSEIASKQLKASTLKNDSGLVIPALNNFPSAYTKYVEETLNKLLAESMIVENREVLDCKL